MEDIFIQIHSNVFMLIFVRCAVCALLWRHYWHKVLDCQDINEGQVLLIDLQSIMIVCPLYICFTQFDLGVTEEIIN